MINFQKISEKIKTSLFCGNVIILSNNVKAMESQNYNNKLVKNSLYDLSSEIKLQISLKNLDFTKENENLSIKKNKNSTKNQEKNFKKCKNIIVETKERICKNLKDGVNSIEEGKILFNNNNYFIVNEKKKILGSEAFLYGLGDYYKNNCKIGEYFIKIGETENSKIMKYKKMKKKFPKSNNLLFTTYLYYTEIPNKSKLYSVELSEKYDCDLLNCLNIKENFDIIENKRLKICKNIIDGVFELHKGGFFHCDLKLENVLLKDIKKDLKVVITDFGCATKEKYIKYYGTSIYFSETMIKYFDENKLIKNEKFSSEKSDMDALERIIAEILQIDKTIFSGKEINFNNTKMPVRALNEYEVVSSLFIDSSSPEDKLKKFIIEELYKTEEEKLNIVKFKIISDNILQNI